jgi:hypothetical protein
MWPQPPTTQTRELALSTERLEKSDKGPPESSASSSGRSIIQGLSLLAGQVAVQGRRRGGDQRRPHRASRSESASAEHAASGRPSAPGAMTSHRDGPRGLPLRCVPTGHRRLPPTSNCRPASSCTPESTALRASNGGNPRRHPRPRYDAGAGSTGPLTTLRRLFVFTLPSWRRCRCRDAPTP